MPRSMLLIPPHNRHRRHQEGLLFPILLPLMIHSETCQKQLKIESRVIVEYWKIRGLTQLISRG